MASTLTKRDIITELVEVERVSALWVLIDHTGNTQSASAGSAQLVGSKYKKRCNMPDENWTIHWWNGWTFDLLCNGRASTEATMFFEPGVPATREKAERMLRSSGDLPTDAIPTHTGRPPEKV